MSTFTIQRQRLAAEQNEITQACPRLAVSYVVHLRSLGITTVSQFVNASPDVLAQGGLDRQTQAIIRTHIEGV